MQKPMLLALAHAICDGAARVVTNVPGFGGTQVFDAVQALYPRRLPLSFHEEVAYAIAHGAALAGQRAVALLKVHGLAKAANSVLDSLAAGVNAGLVVLVFDDQFGEHSDGIVEAGALMRGLKIPFAVPAPANVYPNVLRAFVKSESLGLPIALLINAGKLAQPACYRRSRVAPPRPDCRRNVAQHLLCPWLARYQRQVLDAKLSGKAWRALKPPALPVIPDALPGKWRNALRAYAIFFDAFRKIRGDIVTGDTGLASYFAFPPYNCLDICTYMGGSIPLAIGAYLAGYHKAWAVTGDFAFVAAGHLGLIEALQRNIPLKVIVMRNQKAQTTGGQIIPGRVLETVLQGYARYVRTIHNPGDADQVAAVLNQAKRAKDMRIIIVDYRGHTQQRALDIP